MREYGYTAETVPFAAPAEGLAGDIPNRNQIARMNAGTLGGSRYANTRHEVWSAIRDRWEQRSRLTAAELASLTDATEWAQVLDGSLPARRGSELEIAYFAERALDALPPAA